MLLAGPISHTSTQYMDFVENFNTVLNLSTISFSHFSNIKWVLSFIRSLFYFSSISLYVNIS